MKESLLSEDGNGDGDGSTLHYVSKTEFTQYQSGEKELCLSYRTALHADIANMEKRITFAFYLVGGFISILSLINLYLSYMKGI